MSMQNGDVYKRSYLAHFLDENFGSTPHYVIQGADLESGAIETGINSESKTNILDEVSFRITEYVPTFENSSYVARKGDKIFEKLWDNFWAKAPADAYETTAVDVRLDSEGNIEKAYRTKVRLAPTSFGGDGGGELQAPFTVNYVGTPEALIVSTLAISNGVLTISSIGG